MNNRLLSLALIGSIALVGCGSDDEDTLLSDQTPQLDIVETAQSDDRFDTLVSAVVAADLVSTLQAEGPYTVFAPTDDAFTTYLTENALSAQELLAADALADILTYHVYAGKVLSSAAITLAGSSDNVIEMVNGDNAALSLSGSNLNVNLSQVIVADVEASNGVIHAINKVLVPPTDSPLSDTNATIAELVTALAGAAESEFTTLLAALSQEGLDVTLDGDGPFTVFAPTDAAFEALIAATEGVEDAADLLALDGLDDILKQHVVSGTAIDSVTAFAANGANLTTLNTNDSAELTVSIDSGALNIEGSTVVITDVKASNGIIHVIDQVILTTD